MTVDGGTGDGAATAQPHRVAALVDALSAQGTMSRAQGRWLLGVVCLALVLGALGILDRFAMAVLGLIFLLGIALRVGAVIDSLTPFPRPAPVEPGPADTYAVLVPLHREVEVVPQLVAAMAALRYPPALLEVLFLLEADDDATRDALAAVVLPPWFRVVVVPPGRPRTKPRALNHGLAMTAARYVVVYDAEDVPEPDQLLVALAHFRALPESVIGLQAALAPDNPEETWLARHFAFEYAMLFDVLRPGLSAAALPFPLGGTSNHFRAAPLAALGGWDPWNVTEDADLAVRLARRRLAVRAIPSTTHEEAPVRLQEWWPQRRRWMKGWMQTALTHTRSPVATVRAMGAMPAFVIATVIAGTLLGQLIGLPLAGAFVLLLLEGVLPMEQRPLELALAMIVFAAGLLALAIPAWLAARRRKLRGWVWWLVTSPAYQALTMAATWAALRDLLLAPHHWHKTRHGVARGRPSRSGV